MSQATTSRYVTPTDPSHFYSQIQQFYARHFQLLDSGAAEEWALTFTQDGSFARHP